MTLFLELGEDASFWEALVAPDLEQRVFALEPGCCTVAFDDDYLDDIAVAFGQVIDAKSPYTGGHSARVADVARAIADEVGIEPSEARRLWRAAILHDIGKLGVSNRVLDKPGKLDDLEWGEMRHHAALSTEILSRVTAMHDLAVVAGSHHERLDGRGYPLGLDWRTISVATRIITVADIFDALTADRPYRAAMPLSEAFAILDAETGDVVDATIVAALKSVVASGRLGGLPAIPTALR